MHTNKTIQQRPPQDRNAELPRSDIFPNLPLSGGYDHNITEIDVFSRYLFAYPVTRLTATAIVTDLGTQFNAQKTQHVMLLQTWKLILNMQQ